jgi:hypothetical protein
VCGGVEVGGSFISLLGQIRKFLKFFQNDFSKIDLSPSFEVYLIKCEPHRSVVQGFRLVENTHRINLTVTDFSLFSTKFWYLISSSNSILVLGFEQNRTPKPYPEPNRGQIINFTDGFTLLWVLYSGVCVWGGG